MVLKSNKTPEKISIHRFIKFRRVLWPMKQSYILFNSFIVLPICKAGPLITIFNTGSNAEYQSNHYEKNNQSPRGTCWFYYVFLGGCCWGFRGCWSCGWFCDGTCCSFCGCGWWFRCSWSGCCLDPINIMIYVGVSLWATIITTTIY